MTTTSSAAGRRVTVRARCASTARKISRIKAVRVTAAIAWLAVSTFTGLITGCLLAIAALHNQVTFSGISGYAARLAIADIAVLLLVTLDGVPIAWWRYHTRAARSGS